MSHITTKEIACPYCQFPNTAEVWSIINVREDPELKDILLGGELNMEECTSCKEIFYAEDVVLYHDSDRELMAFVYPAAYLSEKATYEEKTVLDFETVQSLQKEGRLNYEPVTLFGMDALLQLVAWDEESQIQSQIVSFIVKDKGLQSRVLEAPFSRAQKIPQLVPLVSMGGLDLREAVIRGLLVVLETNDRLDLYKKFSDTLNSQPSFEFRFRP